jgi:hypothetical protein
MKKESKLKVAILFMIFEVIWLNKEKWQTNKVSYRFRFRPRKISTTIICIVLSPYYLIRYGIEGVVNLFKTSYDPLGSISFHFVREQDEDRPSIWKAYQKFFI